MQYIIKKFHRFLGGRIMLNGFDPVLFLIG